MKHRLIPALAAMALASASALAQNSNQGVSKTEITIGSIQDLSGPIAGFGKQVRQGMLLRVEEANEQGGVNGRKIVLNIEDSAYDPKKAVLAAQKLVNQDKVFAVVGHLELHLVQPTGGVRLREFFKTCFDIHTPRICQMAVERFV